MTSCQQYDRESPPPKPRPDSPVFGCPVLKAVIIDAALKGRLTAQEVDELFIEYGLLGA